MKIILFEDEPENAERLIHLLNQCPLQVTDILTIGSVSEGTSWFKQNGADADLIFMDIQLSDGNCFEIFETISSRIPIIFTTAYDSFALQAFKLYSVDYLMKPIDLKDLKRAIEKFEQFSAHGREQIDLSAIAQAFFKREDSRFIGKINNQLVYVKAKDIAYLYVDNGMTWAATNNGQKVPLDYSLDQIEKMLDKALFFRINRKMIIHIDAIQKIFSYYNNRLVLQLIPATDISNIVSRERVSNFKRWLEGNALV